MEEIALHELTSEEAERPAQPPEVDTSPKQLPSVKYGSFVDVPGGNGGLAAVDDLSLDI